GPLFSNNDRAVFGGNGFMTHVGGTTALAQPPGSAEQFVFTLPLNTFAPGVLTFTPGVDPERNIDNGLFGYDRSVLPDEIAYNGATIIVVLAPEPSSIALAVAGLISLMAANRRRHHFASCARMPA